jgi:hypothetical protein
MARIIRKDNYVQENDGSTYGVNVFARIVSILGGLLVSLLALRLILMLLGANRDSSVVDFIYTLSYPFVAPFFGVFNYTQQFGRSVFEVATLFAIVVYMLLTWFVIRMLELGNR